MKLYNIVKVYTSTVGTGTVTLGSAVPSFITFATAGVVNGSTVSYAIEDGNNREVGTGTYTSGAETLTRSVVTSTNSNNLITLSGNAVVFITGLAADLSSDTANVASTLVQRDASGNFAAGAATLSSAVVPLIIGGTGTTSTLTLRSTSGVGTTGADIIFQTGNNGATEVMRLQNGGNVGIGRSPGYKFDVNGVVSRSGDTGTASYLQIGANATDLNNYLIGCETGSFVFYQGRYGGSTSERMRIDSSGNVGIGTSSPLALLSVGSGSLSDSSLPIQINAASSSQVWFGINKGGGYGGLIGYSNASVFGSSLVIRNVTTTDPIVFVTNNTSERMRILSTGEVGIGTSSPSSNGKLTVTGNIIFGSPAGRNTAFTNNIGIWTVGDPLDDNRANIGFATVAGAASSSSYITFATNNYGVSGGERMRIDSSGNVGIGTGSTIRSILNTHVGTITGPAVTAGLTLTAFYSGVTAVNTIDWNYSGQSASPVRLGATFNSDGNGMEMVFYTSTAYTVTGSERMRINKDGNVGIGTSSPAQKLDVVGNLLLSGQSTAEQYIKVGYARSGSGYSYIDLQGDTTYGYGTRLIRGNTGANAISSLEHRGTGDMRMVNYEAAPICFYTSSSEKVRIDSSGNIIVGNASAAVNTLRYLDLYNTDTGSSAGAIIRLITSNSAGTGSSTVDLVRYKTGLFLINNNDSNGIIAINNAGSECMRIDSTGNVGIGTTSPSTLLHVKSSGTNFSQIRIDTSSASASPYLEFAENGTVKWYQTNDAGTDRLYIIDENANDGVYLAQNATSWTANSDARLKNVIGPILGAVEKLNSINGVLYSWKSDSKNRVYPGVLAQDVQSVLPEAVDSDVPERLGVRYTELIPLLVNAIKELKAEIDILKARN